MIQMKAEDFVICILIMMFHVVVDILIFKSYQHNAADNVSWQGPFFRMLTRIMMKTEYK